MKKENMNLLDGMNYQEDFSMSPLEVRKTVRHHGNRRRLVLLIILLICTLSLLGSATYAWFTANKLVRVEDMQINVNVANGLEISSDANDWKQAISLYDLYAAAGIPDTTATVKTDSEDAGAVNQFPQYLHNISSIGNIAQYHKTTATSNNNRLELFTGKASSVCDVPKNPSDPTSINTKPVGISNGDGVLGDSKPSGGNYGLEDCIIGEFCADVNGDGTVDPNTECDKKNHSVTTGLVASAPYAESRVSCRGTSEKACAGDVDTIAFDLYLKLDEASNIKLAQGSSVTRIGEDNLGLENTIRVAFVTLGTQPSDFYYAEDENVNTDGKGKLETAPGKDDGINVTAGDDGKANAAYNTTFGGFVGKYGARTMNAFGSITIWEPNNDQHTEAAVQNAKKNYNLTINQTDDITTEGIWSDLNNPDDYLPLPLIDATKDETPEKFAPQQEVTDVDAANTAFNSPGTTTHKPYKNKIGYIKSHGKLEEDGSKYLFSAPKGVTKVRVYIWVEGNDVDTENNATASRVNVNLLFTSASTSGETPATFDGTTNSEGKIVNAFEKYSPDNQIPISDTSITWRETPAVAAAAKQHYTPPTGA